FCFVPYGSCSFFLSYRRPLPTHIRLRLRGPRQRCEPTVLVARFQPRPCSFVLSVPQFARVRHQDWQRKAIGGHNSKSVLSTVHILKRGSIARPNRVSSSRSIVLTDSGLPPKSIPISCGSLG